jgi:lipopolysaccharide export system permease protein
MARQGVWPIWQGMWLSSFILLALGIFLTYKAVNDSVMFNSEVWVNFFKRIIGKKEVRNYVKKDVIMTYPDYHKDLDHITSLDEKVRKYLDKNNKFLSYTSFWKNGFDTHDLNEISSEMEVLVEDLRNSDENFIIGKLMDYPVIRKKKSGIFQNPGLRKACAIIFPIGILIYFVELYRRKGNKNDVAVIGRVNQDLTIEIQKFLERSKDV